MVSLQEMCRAHVNLHISDRDNINHLQHIPRILQNWLKRHHVKDKLKLLAHKFNLRARNAGLKVRMVYYRSGWHMKSCVRCSHCICTDLLYDSGRVFNDSPSEIQEYQKLKYFVFLSSGIDRYKFNMNDNGHFHYCKKLWKSRLECPCELAIKNPEQFFKIPLHERYKPPSKFEIQELREKWNKERCLKKKFNIFCRVVGIFLKFKDDGHLNNCYGNCCIRCELAAVFPEDQFIEYIKSDLNTYLTFDDSAYHSENCARVKILQDPFKQFPENFKCTCT